MAYFYDNTSESKAQCISERNHLPHSIPANDEHVESNRKEHCDILSSIPVQSIPTGDNIELPSKEKE